MAAPRLDGVAPVDHLPPGEGEVPEAVDVVLVELDVPGEGGAAGAAAGDAQHVAPGARTAGREAGGSICSSVGNKKELIDRRKT